MIHIHAGYCASRSDTERVKTKEEGGSVGMRSGRCEMLSFSNTLQQIEVHKQQVMFFAKLALSQPKLGERFIALEKKTKNPNMDQLAASKGFWDEEEFVHFTTCSPQSCQETRRMLRALPLTDRAGDITSQ